MRIIISIFIVIFSTINCYAKVTATDVLQEINSQRHLHLLPALHLNAQLNLVAKQHSHRMATHEIPFGHQDFAQRFKIMRKIFPDLNGAAENVAYRYATAKIVVDGWMHSRGHRQNILGNFKYTGIGVVYDNQGHPWYTQVFVRAPQHERIQAVKNKSRALR